LLFIKSEEIVVLSPSHEEKGLVTIERFLGCADSAVLILNECWLHACMI